MTLVVIGPVTNDLVVIGNRKSNRVGGATYFQSFVFEEFFKDYRVIVNCSDEHLIDAFPDKYKVQVIKKENSHFFINEYPFRDNLDVRHQLSNFAKIPIFPSDLKDILPDDIGAFVLNPLNRHDFPIETVEYLKSFDVPIFLSVQGFLRTPDVEVNENYTIKLDNFKELPAILSLADAIFLDESEKNILGDDIDVDEIIITDGSHGSRVLSDKEYKIEAVPCDNIVDSTGCGDTYMAAYISKKLTTDSILKSANFASKIASDKLSFFGPFKGDI
ncbi:MAG: ribokinase [Methanobrevibacter sp.]|uniref:PfkB family carbohydrate kinase n=1 Tax=Methanobrevibacter sp. TaxID=66852 RepID=UPI0025FAD68A|nr:PfkB family carbohydrate kinase [Methanobrevibacter sp.]MBR0271962.1 ribokinase [Methanobrevibacter sp.]